MSGATKITMTDIGSRDRKYDVSDTSVKGDIKNSGETECLQSRTSSCKTARQWCSRKFTLKLLKRRLPILLWLPTYSIEDLKGDLIAGITVALTVIPQGLALASLAGLPPQYGLYTAFMGCFMYTIFGSCKNLTIGPTAIMSLMTAEHTSNGGIMYVILITFLTGCIQLIMGVLNLGFLVSFISSSVVSGFTSAAAITIATTQISGIFGIKSSSDGFIGDLKTFFDGISNEYHQFEDMAMGLSSIAFLFILKYCDKLNLNRCGSYGERIIGTFLKTVSTARNALLVLLCSSIAAILLSQGINKLALTEPVHAGLPPFAFPKFTYVGFNNQTNQTEHRSFIDIVQHMGSGLVILPLLCLLEAIAIAKSFSKGKRIDSTQEMIAIGICNITGSFVSSYPATGSFSRTAINYSSGVRTPAGGIVTGTLVLLALGFMSPYFQYIPKASLSALIFISVLNMVHYKDVLVMWKTNKLDLLPFCATFFISFILGLEYGIISGIGTSMILLLFQEGSPKISIVEKKTYLGCEYLYIKPDRTTLFPAAEILQTSILKAVPVQEENNMYCVLIDGDHITTIDYTMAMNLTSLGTSLKNENVSVVLINVKPDVQLSIKGAGTSDFMFFASIDEAENHIDAISACSGDFPPAYCQRHSLRSDDASFLGS